MNGKASLFKYTPTWVQLMSRTPALQQVNSLLDIMRRLRDRENGCPWDIEQNFASIAQYTIEEAYEVSDAVDRENYADLKEELGDLLLQVVFHSQMASEQELFDFGDVVTAISSKMVRRHPHVFGGERTNNQDAVAANWETMKAIERVSKNDNESILSGVARALPALLRAQKIQKRAARVGFDWPNKDGAVEKLHEEIAELTDAQSDSEQFEEFGDLLFAAVNVARHLNIDAEAALKAGTAKFERRFRAMESQTNGEFASRSLEEKELLWQQVKLSERFAK